MTAIGREPGQVSGVRSEATRFGHDAERLVIASNRLPVSDGPAAGGLAHGLLDALAERDAIWFGCDGRGEAQESRSTAMDHLATVRVALPQAAYASYYDGFCNSVLWPLCHEMPERIRRAPGDVRAYRQVNRLFAATMQRSLRAYDLLWLQDYHLLPLGRYLRELGVTSRMNFFFHVPVPDPKQLTRLPEVRRMFAALAAYDTIGVQTVADAARLRRFPLHSNARIVVAPVGIDVEQVQRAARRNVVPLRRRARANVRLIVGVDRLDYTKGLLERLQGFDILLRDWPSHRERVVLEQVVAPCRAGAAGYGELLSEVRSRVSDINRRWGTSRWRPVRLRVVTLPRERVAGLLRSADVGLVTPLRDGMNLVAKEFVAAQDADDPGVLVLSRQAGVAEALTRAQLVDARDPNQIARAIDRGLNLTPEQRRRNQRRLLANLLERSAADWADKLIASLREGNAKGARLAQADRRPTEAVSGCG